MIMRTFWIVTATLLGGFHCGLLTNAFAQETAQTQELQLNLEAFKETTKPESTELELNLDQFKKANEGTTELNLEQFENTPPANNEGSALNLDQFEKSPTTNDTDTTLNLDQFDKANEANTNTPGATEINQPARPEFRYKRELIVGAITLLVFLYILSRRRRKR